MKELFSAQQCAFFSPNFCSASPANSRFSGAPSVQIYSSPSAVGANLWWSDHAFPQSSGNPRCTGACSPVSYRLVQQIGVDFSSCHSRLASIGIKKKCRRHIPASQSQLRQSRSSASGTGHAIQVALLDSTDLANG